MLCFPSGFVGPQHLHALVRLLGYQGVAVVVSELLGVARGLLHGTLAQFTRALQQAMPRHCKLPRYDYGSNGVLGYYHAQLTDIVQYPDARTELFHAFRELGNIILFTQLIEQVIYCGRCAGLLPRAADIVQYPNWATSYSSRSSSSRCAGYYHAQLTDIVHHTRSSSRAWQVSSTRADAQLGNIILFAQLIEQVIYCGRCAGLLPRAADIVQYPDWATSYSSRSSSSRCAGLLPRAADGHSAVPGLGNIILFTQLIEQVIYCGRCAGLLPRAADGHSVLGYYHAQLTDIVQYPDARTELFHAFRELGNIILFTQLIEQLIEQVIYCGRCAGLLPRAADGHSAVPGLGNIILFTQLIEQVIYCGRCAGLLPRAADGHSAVPGLGNIILFTQLIEQVIYCGRCVLGYYHAQLTDIVQYPDARTELFHAFRELGNIILFTQLIEQVIYCGRCAGLLPRAADRHSVLGYYHAQLTDIVQYPDARTELFHAFRELGNIILFTQLIEQALSQEEVTDLLHAAPFQNILPRPYAAEGEKPETKQKRLEAKYAALQIVQNVDKYGTAKQSQLAREGDLLTRERLCCGLSLFAVVLRRLRACLVAPHWPAPPAPPHHAPAHTDDTTEFHRLWSALQFLYCIPVGDTQFTVEELFGEGLHWAGCTLIALLGQQRRFEALDFCYHILRVQRVDGKDELVKGIPLKRMVDRIRRFQVLNSQIFGVLARHLAADDERAGVEHVRCFPPPQAPTHIVN
ncbi:cytoplasmic fragile-X interacting family domain-containing protein [Phthorimaea operculella]|nr:cytoplasmic fragile-X interacting family domain-containing protein [Phthorimaea operculella]